ncbi:MAG TPA: helix-turn-helix domain-containing protein [Candidatus Dormibacteraeota bacterium]|jgi:DNA-binding Xre family transcriptional regulator|nr:helix-turn-helix domain-containing protein [Candidatus Dormibacteraeota bacterium]
MIHRHLDYDPALPVEGIGTAAVDDILDRGDLEDWAPLAASIAKDPWGPIVQTILHLCEAHPMYGTSALWRAYIATRRAAAAGGAESAWPRRAARATMTEVRSRRGLSQAKLGQALGMNQSEVSRLERRSDVRLSTLTAFVAATGGQLRLTVVWPDRADSVQISIGEALRDGRPSA